MAKIESRLSEIMGRHRIKQSELAQATGLTPVTINELFHDRRASFTKETLTAVLKSLRAITGKPYTVGDLFEYVEED